MIIWILGPPGSGKTFIARLLSQMTGFRHYEGDEFHTEEDRRAVAAGLFTVEHRHQQLAKIIAKLREDCVPDAIVTHPLPDKASRALIREVSDGTASLIYVRAPFDLIEERIGARNDHHFTVDLLEPWMTRHWKEPEPGECYVIDNDPDARPLIAQLEVFLQSH